MLGALDVGRHCKALSKRMNQPGLRFKKVDVAVACRMGWKGVRQRMENHYGE